MQIISALIVTVCVGINGQGECNERLAWLAGTWEGPESYQLCHEQLAETELTLEQKGLADQVTVYCENNQ